MDANTIRERVYARTAELAGLSAQDISAQTTLDSAGLDSSDAVILALEVEELTGTEIDVGIFLRFSTLGEAVDELVRILRPATPAP
jgi:acyl carrier protein